MRCRAILLAMSIGLGVVSCGENAPPSSSSGAGQLNAAGTSDRPQQLVTQAPSPGSSKVSRAGGKPGPASPKAGGSPSALAAAPNAQWTILVYTERGPGHIEQAATDKQLIIQKTGRTDYCYVISQADVSNIYFGAYRTIDDPKDRREAERARADLQMVKNLEMFVEGPAGREKAKPFEHCALVPMSAPDPDSPPEWNLANVDKDKDPKDTTRAYWSLQIMAFKGIAERKQYAVDMVRDLRKQGVAAYYYHGESVSSVCVGAWPPLAVKAQDSDGSNAKTLSRPEQSLLVTAEPLPDGIVPRKLNGEDIRAVSPKLEIQDPTLVKMIREYPDHIVNGHINYHRTRSGGKVKDPTFLVVIPRPKGNGLYDSDDVAPPPPPAAVAGGAEPGGAFGPRQVGSAGTPVDAPTESVQPHGPQTPVAPATPGVGRLRRIGEN